MPEYGLLAWPAGHSLSPRMHNAALKALGLPGTYGLLEVPPEGLEVTLDGMRRDGTRGVNVSVPHKEAVMPYMDEVTEAARRIGAVNTITVADGRLFGDNTDAHGFMAALAAAGQVPRGRALVIGAGGSARAVLYALAPLMQVTVTARRPEQAAALAEEFGATAAPEPSEALPGVALLVNTTPVGMERDGLDPDESPLGGIPLPPGAFVMDLVYRPARTRLLRDAEAAGLRGMNGLEMLVQQGARSFEIWTGFRAPEGVMRAALSRP